jgi:prevent-host-death family protein
MKHQVISVTQFKANCLKLLDDIGKRGGTLTITKRGRPLASVHPAEKSAWRSPEGAWVGKVQFDVDPLDMSLTDLWEVVQTTSRRRNPK